MPSWLKLKTKNYCYKLKNHVMKKNLRHLILSVAAIMALSGCQEKLRNTEELVDPWLRERTPVNVRLDRQIGPAIISSDWRTDSLGTVSVSLVTPELDMSAVKVVALDFAYPESEHCPSASIKPGDTIDLSDGFEEFVVTAKTGETRTYTITYTNFKDPIEGCYSFTPVGGILDTSHSYKCGCVMIGGFEKWITLCQVMDKHWLWDYNRIYWPQNEDDNILSFRLDRADDQTGETFGTIVNTPGPDGKYADYQLKSSKDDPKPVYNINEQYRLIPAGKSRWAKHGDGYITIYAYEDVNYEKPLHKLELLDKNHKSFNPKYVVKDDKGEPIKENGEDKTIEAYVFWEGALDSNGITAEKALTIPSLAFHRSFGEGPFTNKTDDWSDARWYVNNIRNVFWFVQKDTDSVLEDHEEWLKK